MSQLQTLNVYDGVIGENLRERLAKIQKSISLRSELDILRVIAADAIEAYELACKAPAEKNLGARISAGQIVIEAVKNVRDMVAIINRADEASAMDMVALQSMASCVSRIIDTEMQRNKAAFEIAGIDPNNIIDAVHDGMSEYANNGARGTRLTPDMDVMEMDKTVPKEPETKSA